jgi:hypothetical protein
VQKFFSLQVPPVFFSADSFYRLWDFMTIRSCQFFAGAERMNTQFDSSSALCYNAVSQMYEKEVRHGGKR